MGVFATHVEKCLNNWLIGLLKKLQVKLTPFENDFRATRYPLPLRY